MLWMNKLQNYHVRWKVTSIFHTLINLGLREWILCPKSHSYFITYPWPILGPLSKANFFNHVFSRPAFNLYYLNALCHIEIRLSLTHPFMLEPFVKHDSQPLPLTQNSQAQWGSQFQGSAGGVSSLRAPVWGTKRPPERGKAHLGSLTRVPSVINGPAKPDSLRSQN